MNEKDPLKEIERILKETHDGAGKYTKPVFKRYPLLFAFFLTFSVAAILHGFELMTDQFEIFHQRPSLLIIIGALALFLTGTLYKLLEKDEE